jgi:rod shape determining protein RodA
MNIRLNRSIYKSIIVFLGVVIGLVGLFAVIAISPGELLYPLGHLLSTFIGLLLFFYFSSRTPIQLYNLAGPIYTAVIIACLMAIFTGDAFFGARKLIPFTAHFIAPAEFFMMAIPLIFFRYSMTNHKSTGLLLLTVIMMPLLIVLLMPDLRLIITIFISSTICLILMKRYRLIGGIAMLSGAGMMLAYFSIPYRLQRLLIVINPKSDPYGAGWELLTMERAINKSGLTGLDWSAVRNLSTDPIHLLHAESLLRKNSLAYFGIDYGLIGMFLVLSLVSCLLIMTVIKALFIKQTNLKIIALTALTPFLIYLLSNSAFVISFVYSFGNPLPIISLNPALTISTFSLIGLVFAFSKMGFHYEYEYKENKIEKPRPLLTDEQYSL